MKIKNIYIQLINLMMGNLCKRLIVLAAILVRINSGRRSKQVEAWIGCVYKNMGGGSKLAEGGFPRSN